MWNGGELLLPPTVPATFLPGVLDLVQHLATRELVALVLRITHCKSALRGGGKGLLQFVSKNMIS